MLDQGGFPRGPLPLEVDGSLVVGAGLNALAPLPSPALSSAPRRDVHASPALTEDDLRHLLDSLAPTPVTGPLSSSHSAPHSGTFPDSQEFPVDHHSSPLFGDDQTSLGFLLDSFLTSDSPAAPAAPPRVKPQLPSTFSMDGKGFDAGDIHLPFDLSLPLFDTIAYPVLPVAPSAATTSLGPGVDPHVLDSSLDSPLAFSQDASPWSELLASPMFSLATTSEPTSAKLANDLPLPPNSPSSLPDTAISSSFADALAALPMFPPLSSVSTSFATLAPPAPVSETILRPLPPAPVRPTATPVQPTSLSNPSRRSSSSSSSTSLPTSNNGAPPATSVLASTATLPSKPEPNGFRTTTPLLDLSAPIQSRNPVLPSVTSRKRKTAAAEKALAKRARQAHEPSPEVVAADAVPESTPANTTVVGEGEVGDLPADIVAAIERKRLQNTLSARKSRMRKQARMQELEAENRALMEENETLRTQLAAFEKMMSQP